MTRTYKRKKRQRRRTRSKRGGEEPPVQLKNCDNLGTIANIQCKAGNVAAETASALKRGAKKAGDGVRGAANKANEMKNKGIEKANEANLLYI